MLKLVSTNDEFYLIASVATYVHVSLPGFLTAQKSPYGDDQCCKMCPKYLLNLPVNWYVLYGASGNDVLTVYLQSLKADGSIKHTRNYRLLKLTIFITYISTFK